VKIKSIIVALTLVAIALFSTNEVAAAQTGGVTVPCAGSINGSGWFSNGVWGAVICTQTDNHIVVNGVDQYGVQTVAIIDMWYSASCDKVSFFHGSGNTPFKVHTGNNVTGPTQFGCGILWVPVQSNGAQWFQTHYVGLDPYWGAQGVYMCRMTFNRSCANGDGGWWTARSNGTNNGPHYQINFEGVGPSGNSPSLYGTSVSALRI
jgi:hypothetical protein